MGATTVAGDPRRNKLILGLRSSNADAALRAVAEMREEGWLEDGSLVGADLDDANLPGANLSRANLQSAVLIGANLEGARLDEADLRQAGMRGANLRGAILNSARLEGSKLQLAELRGADLSNATLQEADLLEAGLAGTLLHNADMLNAVNASHDQMAQAFAMLRATMPGGSRYDGRYRLAGDLLAAATRDIDAADEASMARYYEVTNEDYVIGQEWAQESLAELRDETAYVELMAAIWNDTADPVG